MLVETLSLERFIETGQCCEFMEIHIGMSKNTLLQLLSTPTFSYPKQPSNKASILYYGNFEFYFERGKNGRLEGIQYKPNANAEPVIRLKAPIFSENLTFSSALEHFNSKSITYEIIQQSTHDVLDEVKRIQMPRGNVQLVFLKKEKEYYLERISQFIHFKQRPLQE